MCERGLAYTKCNSKSTVAMYLLTTHMMQTHKTWTSGNVLRSKQVFAVSTVTQVWEDWNGKRSGQPLQSWSHCAHLLLSLSFFRLPALGPTALIFLFLHVFARHPLSPLRQPLTSRALFTCPEAAAMVTRMALWEGKNITKTRVSYMKLQSVDVSPQQKNITVFTKSSSHLLSQTMAQFSQTLTS